MTEIVLAPGETDELVIGEDEILQTQGVEFTRTHTGTGTWQATVSPGQDYTDRFFDEVLLRDSGDTLFRGFLLRVNERRNSLQTTLGGKGLGYELTNGSAAERYQSTLAHEAIEDYWSNQTNFSATVTTPTADSTATGETVQEADTTSEFQDITSLSDTQPIVIENDTFKLAQAAFHREGENNDAGFIGATATNSAASDGEAASLFDTTHDPSYEFDLGYTVPESAVSVAVRARFPNDPDSDSNFEAPGFNLTIDGNVAGSQAAGEFGDDTFQWIQFENEWSSGDLTAGSHTLQLNITDDSNNGTLRADTVVAYDNRFSFTFDNSVGPNGHLSGPELYPPDDEILFDEVDTAFNITLGTLDTTFNNTSGSQRLQLQLNGGTWFPNDGTEDNTESVTTDFNNTNGDKIRGRARLSRFGSRSDATPTSGFNGQQISTWNISIDSNDLVFINDRTFEGSHLQNLQALHDAADMRFVIEHNETSKDAQSFQPGDVTGTLPSEVTDGEQRVNSTVRRSVSNYHNDVTVRGATVSGSRLTSTKSDSDEVSSFGEQHLDVFDPSLTTQEDVDEQAKSLLEQGLRERVLKGTITTTPVDVLPGLSYSNPFDTNADDVPVEEHRFRVSGDALESRLVFDFRAQELAEQIGGLRRDTRTLGRGQ